MKIFKLVVVSAILIAGLVILFVGPHMGVDWKEPRMARMRNAIDIGEALNKYKLEHYGHLPSQLTDLVPRYIAPADTKVFFEPSNSGIFTGFFHKPDNEEAFTYLGERGIKENSILYERTNVWPQDQDMTSVLTLTTNATLNYRSVRDVATQLKVNSTRQP